MKLKKSLIAGVFVAALVMASAVPAHAYDDVDGHRTCTGVRSVSLYATQNDTVRHWYYAPGTMEMKIAQVIGTHFYWQSYSSSQNTNWKIETFGAFKAGTGKGATCF